MDDKTLRSRILRLARQNPSLHKPLLHLLKRTAGYGHIESLTPALVERWISKGMPKSLLRWESKKPPLEWVDKLWWNRELNLGVLVDRGDVLWKPGDPYNVSLETSYPAGLAPRPAGHRVRAKDMARAEQIAQQMMSNPFAYLFAVAGVSKDKIFNHFGPRERTAKVANFNLAGIASGDRKSFATADGSVHVHVWFDADVARNDFGGRAPNSGEFEVRVTTSPDALNLNPRGEVLAEKKFRYADPRQRALVIASAEDFIRRALFQFRKMAATGAVIPYRVWVHKTNGRTVSIGGAVPYTGAPGNRKEDWEIQTHGWTIRWPDGTTGTGRPPFKTEHEAQAWVNAHPNFSGMSMY